jgi:hypothetical protein
MSDLVDEFITALASYDTDRLATLCTPEMVHWLSLTEREQDCALFLTHLRRERDLVAHSALTVRNRVQSGATSILMLQLDGSLHGGATFGVYTALVLTERDGRIVRIDEIADVSHSKALIASLTEDRSSHSGREG